MRVPLFPENEFQRLDALRFAQCAYAPREERFDRITRTAQRLLHVPISLVSIVEQDEQWFRSVQGIEVAHTPRTFGQEDFDALKDLASMAEAELKINALSHLQSRLLMKLNALQRKGILDPLTGCWNIRGFRELLALGFEDARKNDTDLALCSIHIDNLEEVAAAAHCANLDAVTQLLAQELRQRLPMQGALARLGSREFFVLIPSDTPSALAYQLTMLTAPSVILNLPDSKLQLEISLSIQISVLSDFDVSATSDVMWAHVLAFSGGVPT